MARAFTVPGKPVPQGSMKAFAGRGAAAGKAFTTSSNAGPLAKYRADIQNRYGHDYGMETPYSGPIELYVSFYFKRPASHYNSAGELKGTKYSAPAARWVTKKPDLDKLLRAVGDALTHYAFVDDSQVVSINATMQWASHDGTHIRIFELEDSPVLANG